MEKNANTTLGWYEYQIDFLKLRIKEIYKLSSPQNKKIISARSLCVFIFEKSPISADFAYVDNYIMRYIIKSKKLAEQSYINDIVIINDILRTWSKLGLDSTWGGDSYFSSKECTKRLYELIDDLYELISEVDPDIDTVKIDLDKKFNIELKNEHYDTTDLKSLEKALDNLRPFVAKLEKYHIFLISYIKKNIIPLIDALYEIYDNVEYN